MKLLFNLNNKIEYSLATVGFTDDKFIFAFERQGYSDGYILTTNYQFKQHSSIHQVNIGSIDITTKNNIDTSYNRGIHWKLK
jgi:hypothetical protein